MVLKVLISRKASVDSYVETPPPWTWKLVQNGVFQCTVKAGYGGSSGGVGDPYVWRVWTMNFPSSRETTFGGCKEDLIEVAKKENQEG